MDATVGEKEEAPAPSGGASTPSTSVPVARRAPLPELVAAGASGAAEESGGGVGEDEQVERFYALLANIRSLRSMYGGCEDGGLSSRKRARGSEPPWRPAFRMEDFQEDADAGCEYDRKKATRGRAGRQQHPEKASDEDEGEVFEEKGRVSASQRARTLTRQY